MRKLELQLATFGIVEHDETGSKVEVAEAAEHNDSESGGEVGVSEHDKTGSACPFGVVELGMMTLKLEV